MEEVKLDLIKSVTKLNLLFFRLGKVSIEELLYSFNDSLKDILLAQTRVSKEPSESDELALVIVVEVISKSVDKAVE